MPTSLWYVTHGMFRGDSIILTFLVPSLASRQRQYDIDRVSQKVGKSKRGEIRPIIGVFHLTQNQFSFAVPVLPIF